MNHPFVSTNKKPEFPLWFFRFMPTYILRVFAIWIAVRNNAQPAISTLKITERVFIFPDEGIQACVTSKTDV